MKKQEVSNNVCWFIWTFFREEKKNKKKISRSAHVAHSNMRVDYLFGEDVLQ